MLTNLTRQLKELGMLERLDEVLEEVCHVRRELGYPVMATPYSQIVGVQAVENVVSGERYKRVPDTVIKYLMGFYGEPAGPIDPEVHDRVIEPARGQEAGRLACPRGATARWRTCAARSAPNSPTTTCC